MPYAFWISAVLGVGGKSSETFHEVVVAVATTPLEFSDLFPVGEQRMFWTKLKESLKPGRRREGWEVGQSREGDGEDKGVWEDKGWALILPPVWRRDPCLSQDHTPVLVTRPSGCSMPSLVMAVWAASGWSSGDDGPLTSPCLCNQPGACPWVSHAHSLGISVCTSIQEGFGLTTTQGSRAYDAAIKWNRGSSG